MKIYCDLDGVLVDADATGDFDKRPWSSDGRVLWDYLKTLNPIILSSAAIETLGSAIRQKRAWCRVELGADIQVIVMPTQVGKWAYSDVDSLLLDDNTFGASSWQLFGGIWVHHTNATNSIEEVKKWL